LPLLGHQGMGGPAAIAVGRGREEPDVRHHNFVRVAVPIAVGAIALTSCGSNSSGGGGGAGGGGHTVVIGMSAPLTGPLSALGLGMKNSVDLAVKQANDANKIDGWTVKFEPKDDQADANVGGQVAAALSSESDVVGVVGTLNSSVAQQEQQAYNDANIVMISPANTTVDLTQGPNWTKGDRQRPYASYFRVSTTDAIQGAFAAKYLYETGAHSVATVNDQKAYGAGLVQQFELQFKKLGGKITSHQTITPGDKDFSGVISKIKPTNPAALYYGGEYPEAGPLSKQMKAGGLDVPLMGGDGIFDPTYVKLAGPKSDGDLCTSVGAPTDKLASAAQFVKDYKAASYKEDFSAYGAYSYDAANILIEAMAKVLPGKDSIDDSVRQDIIQAVQDTDYNGVAGHVSFDKYGDTTNRVLTVYKVVDGAFKPVKTDTF
jgi:branched-chain amino acid transport system substrate-binding protein